MLFNLLIYLFPINILGNEDACPAVPNGVVINKYYLEECGACKRLAPVIEDIKSRLEKADTGIKYREIECNECECEGIEVFPTLEITEDKVVTSKTTGYKDYTTLSKWFSDKLNLSIDLFGKHRENDGEVTRLGAKDFLTGFDGQWLILFYDAKNDLYRQYIKDISIKYKGRVHVGEIHRSEASSVETRFNIQTFPAVYALNHGTAVPYSGDRTAEALTAFVEKLAAPSFQSINYNELREKAANLNHGEPLYVVLYKSYEVASHYFNDMAQQFKFRVTIFKSNDPHIFSAAGFEPKEMTETGDYNEATRLVLFKNGTFYPCTVPLDKPDSIVQWIFHTHFAHVTEINNNSFYSIFHGMKPVLILISPNELFLPEFNLVSSERHLGTPYLSIVFAYLNSAEYPDFMRVAMPKLRTPALAFYDPSQNKWYVEQTKLTSANFNAKTIATIEKYFAKKLPEFPPKKSNIKYYIVLVWCVLIIAFFAFRKYSERLKLE